MTLAPAVDVMIFDAMKRPTKTQERPAPRETPRG